MSPCAPRSEAEHLYGCVEVWVDVGHSIPRVLALPVHLHQVPLLPLLPLLAAHLPDHPALVAPGAPPDPGGQAVVVAAQAPQAPQATRHLAAQVKLRIKCKD